MIGSLSYGSGGETSLHPRRNRALPAKLPIEQESDGHLAAWRLADALREKNPAAAIGEFKALAQQGSYMSMLTLGWLYLTGTGTPVDLAESERWFKRVAETGSVRAHYYLAATLLRAKHDAAAILALEYAVARGHSPSMVRLGGMYQVGRSIERDLSKAHQLYERAAERGNIFGKARLANLYLRKYKGLRMKLKGARLMASAMIEGASLVLKKQDNDIRLQH